MTNIAMKNHLIFYGKIHYFDWAIFNSYVKLPEGIGFTSVCWNQNIGAKVNPQKIVRKTREVKKVLVL